MYILTPIAPNDLEKCGLLLKGSICLSPDLSLTVSSKGSIVAPYLTLEVIEASGTGSGTMDRERPVRFKPKPNK
eukprot:gene4971-5782_t